MMSWGWQRRWLRRRKPNMLCLSEIFHPSGHIREILHLRSFTFLRRWRAPRKRSATDEFAGNSLDHQARLDTLGRRHGKEFPTLLLAFITFLTSCVLGSLQQQQHVFDRLYQRELFPPPSLDAAEKLIIPMIYCTRQTCLNFCKYL